MARPAYSIEKKEEIESSIRSTALSLFSQQGYRAVSMRAIASELGWSAPALYRYYDNKEALLASIRADGFDQLKTLLQLTRQQHSEGIETAAAAMRAYIEFGVKQPELYSLMYELDQGAITEVPNVANSRRLAFAQAEGIAEDILNQTDLSGDANQMAHLMWIAAHGLIALAVANQLDLGQSLDKLIEPVLQTTLAGLQPI